jgi:probable phosphoglycerate mutase
VTQANQVAEAVARLAVVAVYTSPRARALETARAIARACGLSDPNIEPELREISYGAWEGLLHDEVVAQSPELVRRWAVDPDVAPPGGESLSAMAARSIACGSLLAGRHDGQCIALISHVGPVKALICHALQMEIDGARRLWLDPATISIVDWPLTPGASSSLRLFNSFAHLDDGVRWLS